MIFMFLHERFAATSFACCVRKEVRFARSLWKCNFWYGARWRGGGRSPLLAVVVVSAAFCSQAFCFVFTIVLFELSLLALWHRLSMVPEGYAIGDPLGGGMEGLFWESH